MSDSIVVDMEKLKSVSNEMTGLAADYKKIYNQLYSEVEALQSAWKGKDNTAFTTQIEGFKDDLAKMEELITKYAEFLTDSANRYQTTQDEITSAAKKLQN